MSTPTKDGVSDTPREKRVRREGTWSEAPIPYKPGEYWWIREPPSDEESSSEDGSSSEGSILDTFADDWEPPKCTGTVIYIPPLSHYPEGANIPDREFMYASLYGGLWDFSKFIDDNA